MTNGTLSGSRLARLVIAALAALLLALAVQVVLPMRPANAEKGRVEFKSVQVPADQYWTNTGVTLQDGDELTITATGTMKPGFLGGEYGCGGWADHAARTDWPLPGKPEYGLIGGLKNSSGFITSKFWVGCRLPASPNETWVHHGAPQELVLGINDVDAGDNSGAFQATVEVFREPTLPGGSSTGGGGAGGGSTGGGSTGGGSTGGGGAGGGGTTTNTPPTIVPLKPGAGSKTRDRSPLIVAKVSDRETDLAQSNIKLFVEGKPITNFSYDAARDKLRYQSGRLAYGKYTVKVEATDASQLKGENTWRFKVVRR